MSRINDNNAITITEGVADTEKQAGGQFQADRIRCVAFGMTGANVRNTERRNERWDTKGPTTRRSTRRLQHRAPRSSTTTNDTRGLATNTNLHREQQQTYWTTQTDSIQRVRAHSVNSRQSWSSAKGEHHTQALVRLRTTDHLGPFLRGYI